ncbi:RsmF rRNA methyltransferase first C-terminal domain-containing protein [uncultured Lactobacillus sp.]|uniref:RsmB/NOP family class I SAM-dependent RNA methyltransferase n=1 Tax=uncultured Lactobacillus sp. TaxID=153152 RepID=UPI002804D495|nr:RsmF rRNA methyltransferase first C-terminal domain-containing protein [uncultured Lactobacillus sp.]
MLNLPQDFKEKYRKLLGDQQAEAMFSALNENSKKAFRVNTLKNKTNISYSLDDQVPEIDHAYYGEISGDDPEWVSGYVYSQDPAAMFPAAISTVKPGENVLDLCAAPGGKTTALGEQLKNKGLLVANEISTSRAKILRENVERWGISNALVTNESPENLSLAFPEFFDVILVDAPCSGEGMFRKNPEAIEYWSQDYVLTCSERQKTILNEAVKMLKPGGRLVYSTCTFAPEEDEKIVDWLTKEYGFSILDSQIKDERISAGHPEWGNDNSDLKKTLRFWPQDGVGEGQFAAILQKPGQVKQVAEKKRKNKKNKRTALRLNKNEQELVGEVVDQFNLPEELADWRKKALVSNDHVFVPAIEFNGKTKLHILNNGVEFGVLKKKRFEPGHQLAEVLGQVKQERVIDLVNDKEYQDYLHGETIKVNSDLRGFVLVSYKDMIFSFGKIAGNQVLKNFYPKGLRK